MNKDISVIVPVYNEKNNIEGFIASLKKSIIELDKKCEIIIVDDGSSDGSSSVLDSIEKSETTVIRHKSNKGYGAALKTGIESAEGEFIAIIDCDNSYLPQDILRLTDFMDDYDMVVGARQSGAGSDFPFHQKLAKGLVCFFLKAVFGKEISDINSGLRIIRTCMAKRYIDLLPNGFSFTSSITLISLLERDRIKYVPIYYGKRTGRSKVSVLGYTLRFIMSYCNIILKLRLFNPYGLRRFETKHDYE